MARLILSINVTLDGCCHHMQAIADDEHHQYVTELLSGVEALLFGRITYELFESYWPAVAQSGSGKPHEVAFARVLDSKPKYVASRSQRALAWKEAVLLSGNLAEEVRHLKHMLAGDLLIFGSPGLARTLAELSLIDEYQFVIQPMLTGQGPTLFEGLGSRLDLRHQETRIFRSGILLSRYHPHAVA